MPAVTKPSKEGAINALLKITRKEDSAYDLVPFGKFKRGKNLRSDRYKACHVLCFANTHREAGWLVCNYAVTGGCKLSKALLQFNTSSGGTGGLKRHIAQHTAKPSVRTLPKSIPQMSKAVIARSAALSVALDLRPLSFTDTQEVILHFAQALFHAGQKKPNNEYVDPKSLLPCAKTVTAALSRLADDNRGKWKALLPNMIKIGGGVTTDGVTLKVQEKQFYDLTLHFINLSCTSAFDNSPKFSMRCKTLLLQEKKGEANAEQIRSLLGNALQAQLLRQCHSHIIWL